MKKWIVIGVAVAILIGLGSIGLVGFAASCLLRNREGIALANNGYAAAFRGDHDEAIRMLTAALQKPLFANQRCYVYLSRGTARNWKSQFQEAIEDFTAALRDNPNLAAAYAGRGYALQHTSQLDKALADFGEAIRLDPNSGYAHYNRAQIFYNRHDFDRALTDAEEAVRCDPGSADALVLRGLGYLGKNDLDRALASFDGAIAVDPRNASAYEQRSNLYFRKGDWDKSQRDITQAIRLRPAGIPLSSPVFSPVTETQYRLLLDQANRSLAANEYDRAIDAYDQILNRKINASQASYVVMRRGSCYLWKNELDKAERDFNEAIELNPKNSAAHVNRGRFLRVSGRRPEAIEECNAALRINPNEYSAYDLRADIFRDEGNITAALADLDTLLRLNPKWTAAYVTQAAIYFHANDLDKSIATCNHVLEIKPDAVSAHIIRARAYARKKQYADARRDFESALAGIKPEYLKYQLAAISWVHATSPMDELRDGKKAIDEAIRSCEMYGWRDEFSLNALAAGYADVGKFDDAVKYQQQALELKPGIADRKHMEQRLALYKKHEAFREGPEN
ncbi:MAG TPA: tetratricopeptide repeat protein [Chthoniobacterales bacterium]|jgi:tetratricopeptide (TPR) repeat protein|nr:tetratricopeptide repeat protein [Chthoniobacterales bacterium]